MLTNFPYTVLSNALRFQRAPPVGGRPCFFVMPDVTVPPPTMPPVSTRLGFGVSANGDGQRQQRSMDRAALHQHVAPSVPDVPRGNGQGHKVITAGFRVAARFSGVPYFK